MAVRRTRVQHPLVILDVAVLDVDRNLYRVRNDDGQLTGEVVDKGRTLVVQTAGLDPSMPVQELSVNVALAHDGVEFVEGERYLLLVDYNEWELNGRRGCTMTFAGFVAEAMVGAWAALVKSQAGAIPA